MRTQDFLKHPLAHSALSNVTIDQHHIRPSNIEISNTTGSVPPLPGGPYQWDIDVPYDAQAVMFTLTSNIVVAEGFGKAGVIGVANRSSLDTTCASLGGFTSIAVGAYNAIYSKQAAALNLSHKIWTASGEYIALTSAYLVATGPSTRKLRLEFTNYGASTYTLWCKGEVQILG